MQLAGLVDSVPHLGCQRSGIDFPGHRFNGGRPPHIDHLAGLCYAELGFSNAREVFDEQILGIWRLQAWSAAAMVAAPFSLQKGVADQLINAGTLPA